MSLRHERLDRSSHQDRPPPPRSAPSQVLLLTRNDARDGDSRDADAATTTSSTTRRIASIETRLFRFDRTQLLVHNYSFNETATGCNITITNETTYATTNFTDPQNISFLKLETEKKYRSAHLSMFPLTTLPARTLEDAVNKEHIVIVEATPLQTTGKIEQVYKGYEVPGNLDYFMRRKEDNKYRYNPPDDFKDMLLGKTPILIKLACENASEVNIEIERIGWVDYVHKENDELCVYAGVKIANSIYDVHKYEIDDKDLADKLIEYDFPNPIKIAHGNCSGMSDEDLKAMDAISERMFFIKNISRLRKQAATNEEVQAYINTFKTKNNLHIEMSLKEQNVIYDVSSESIQFREYTAEPVS